MQVVLREWYDIFDFRSLIVERRWEKSVTYRIRNSPRVQVCNRYCQFTYQCVWAGTAWEIWYIFDVSTFHIMILKRSWQKRTKYQKHEQWMYCQHSMNVSQTCITWTIWYFDMNTIHLMIVKWPWQKNPYEQNIKIATLVATTRNVLSCRALCTVMFAVWYCISYMISLIGVHLILLQWNNLEKDSTLRCIMFVHLYWRYRLVRWMDRRDKDSHSGHPPWLQET